MIKSLGIKEFGLGSKLAQDLVEEESKVLKYVGQFYSDSAIAEQISTKNFSAEKRSILVEEINRQYAGVSVSELTKSNTELLRKENTYTITTGHQLNLMTGPLYSVYKIAQVISVCKKLAKQYPDFNFVPLFWLASEDHDFDEINHFHLFGDTIRWDIDAKQKVVGRLELNGIEEVVDQILSKYADQETRDKVRAYTEAYSTSKTLAEATRKLMNHLFGSHGLVILDGDSEVLKKQFAPVAVREIRENLVKKEVSKANESLEQDGYHQQVHVRDCNLFWIQEDGTRLRLVSEGGEISIGEQRYSVDDLVKIVEEHPEQISPNALLRPVYQELILPNLLYIGGAGEISYWMQLKGVFEALEVTMPLIRVRDSIIQITEKDWQVLEDFEVSIADLKGDISGIIKQWLTKHAGDALSLDDARLHINELKEKLHDKVKSDPSLANTVEAEIAKWNKSVDVIEAKLIKSEKRKQETQVNRLEKLKEKIYPANSFQERYVSFLMNVVRDDQYIQSLIDLDVASKAQINIR